MCVGEDGGVDVCVCGGVLGGGGGGSRERRKELVYFIFRLIDFEREGMNRQSHSKKGFSKTLHIPIRKQKISLLIN